MRLVIMIVPFVVLEPPPTILDLIMTLAFNSKHPYVPNPKEDPTASRWIASLSDGTTVFEDVTPGEKSAWRRLREYVLLHKLQVTNLRLEAYGRSVVLVPYKDDEDRPQINGYWYSKFVGALLHSGGVTEKHARGIGILKGKEIWVNWVHEDGSIRCEVKEYNKDNEALIINNPPA